MIAEIWQRSIWKYYVKLCHDAVPKKAQRNLKQADSNLNQLKKAYWIAKTVGWDNIPRRVKYLLEVRAGLMRRKTDPDGYSESIFKARYNSSDSEVASNWQERERRFFPPVKQADLKQLVPEAVWREQVATVCEKALEGHYPFFSNWTGELGWPPNFNLDPVNNIDWPVGQHWTKITKSGPPRDDIKLVWEASRFSLAYYFARHYVYTNDEKWAAAFWELLDSWIEQNPVNQTAAWGCGQETAFRLMAMLFGVFTTIKSESATAERLRKFELLCWQSGKRILSNIDYAISQKNNHAISEAVGLWSLGLVFTEFTESKVWINRGQKVLASEARRQIYKDGSFVQHSMNYHRVMLDDYSWAIALGRINDCSVGNVVEEKFAKAVDWLYEFVCLESGRVPNYGPNDGAWVLPLACNDYLDYRPSLQLAHCVSRNERLLPAGGSDESSLWLGVLPESDLSEPRQQQTVFTGEGGFHILRNKESMLMLRAVDYRDRPNQADNMHVDVWFKGENILRDAGSFRYYHADPAMKSYFYSVRAHNAAQFGDNEQMTKGPRFLWLEWPRIETVVGEDKLASVMKTSVVPSATHKRHVERIHNVFHIKDEFECDELVTVRWRLSPDFEWEQVENGIWEASVGGAPYRLVSVTPATTEISQTEGLESLYYGRSQPCPVIEVKGKMERLETYVGPSAEIRKLLDDAV